MNQPVKAAICSFGMSGKVFHAPFLSVHPGFELYAVWERTRKEAAAAYPAIISYNSYEELLANEAIELVVVNTPTYTHYAYAKQALLAGKHVLVEKAFTITVAEAKELAGLAVAAGKKLCVYQNRRWDSDFLTVKEVIESGSLGKVVEAEFHFDRYNPGLSPKQHKEVPGPGAGVVYDLGPHIIDQALLLFGPPQGVFADLAIMRPTSQVEDYFEILLLYPDKKVRLKATYFAREAVPAYVVHGTAGSFLKSRGDVQEADLQAGKKPDGADWGQEPASLEGLLHTEEGGVVVRKHMETRSGTYMELFNGLYAAIRNGEEVPVPAEAGIHVIRVIEAVFQSVKSGKIVDWQEA